MYVLKAGFSGLQQYLHVLVLALKQPLEQSWKFHITKKHLPSDVIVLKLDITSSQVLINACPRPGGCSKEELSFQFQEMKLTANIWDSVADLNTTSWLKLC